MNPKKLEKLAKNYEKKLRTKFSDPRYKRVVGKFIAAKLLEHNKVNTYRGPIDLEEVLWVGSIEPRVLELLPAILLRRPKLIRILGEIPTDLRGVLIALKKGVATQDFRGVKAIQYTPWVERIGRKQSPPSVLKTFRFQRADIEKLNSLKQKTGLNETEIVRRAIQRF